MTARPYMKWFPADWRADPRLRMCSLSARGLWADMIAYMHEGKPYGHLTIDGIAPDIRGLASLVGRPLGEVRKALTELEGKQVFSRTDAGVIFSRRMVRDDEKAQEGRKHADNRWGNREATAKPNRAPNGSPNGNPNTYSPESRVQKEKKESSSSVDDGFLKFYELYPRHVGKKAAKKAYEKAVHETTPDAILTALEKQKPQWKDPKFIPHPATWLNRGQWDDETPSSQADWRDSLL